MQKAVLPPSMMVISIIGFIISAVYTASGSINDVFPPSWGENFGISLGFAFCLVFVLMFVASVISMTPTDEELRH